MVSVLVGGLSTARAFAQAGPAPVHTPPGDEERSAARTAATEGVTAYEAGEYQQAIDRFTRAEAIIHAPPHLLYIARSLAKLGKLVAADETYIKVVREQLSPDAPRAFVEAQQKAIEEEAALQPRIPRLQIEVDGPGKADATVTLDDTPLSQAMLGLARPIDPGTHALRAKGKGVQSDLVKVTLIEGAKQTVTLVLKPEEETPAAAPGEAPVQSDGSGTRAAGWVALGVGAVGVVVGTIFLAKNRSKRADADALCPGACPESRRGEIQALDDSADGAMGGAWFGYGLGVAGVATGVVLLLVGGGSSDAKPSDTKASGARVHPWIGPRGAGLVGEF
jgi:hypothetical protein